MSSQRCLCLLILLGLVANSMAQQVSMCRDGLDQQNKYRRNHGAGNLVWDDNLARQAADAARNLASRQCARDGFNANIWSCSGRNCDSCTKAVDNWYSLFKQNFKFNTPRLFSDNQGSFGWWASGSQMIWNSATRAGCAKASGNNCMSYVCFYDTGNIVTDQAFKDNVFPEGGSMAGRNSNNDGRNNNNNNNMGNNGEPAQCAQWKREGKCSSGAFMSDVGISQEIFFLCPITCQGADRSSGVGSGPSIEIPGIDTCKQWAMQGRCARGNTWRDPRTGAVKEVSEWCWSGCRDANIIIHNPGTGPIPDTRGRQNNNNNMNNMNQFAPTPAPGDQIPWCQQWKRDGACQPGWTGPDMQGNTRPVLEICAGTCSRA